MGFGSAVIVLLISIWGAFDTINNNKDCSKLGQANCQYVAGCVWDYSPVSNGNTYTDGGKCVKDTCLEFIDSSGTCSKQFTNINGMTQSCYPSSFSGGPVATHICGKPKLDENGMIVYDPNYPYQPLYDVCDQDDVDNGLCSNATSSSSNSDSDRLCVFQNVPNDCGLAELIKGSCPNGEVSINGEKVWFNCKEHTIDGVKTCLSSSGNCEWHGAKNCTYFPQCMLVDGVCVDDECFGQSYSLTQGSCNSEPEVCTGHKVTRAWYTYTYDGSRYISYDRKYTEDWICTNKNYNNQPNQYYSLKVIGGENVGSTSNVLNYNGPDGSDRCEGTRDLCKWCPKFKIDGSECTEGGGQIVNVDGGEMCTDQRPKEVFEDAASLLHKPSVLLLFSLFATLVVFLS